MKTQGEVYPKFNKLVPPLLKKYFAEEGDLPERTAPYVLGSALIGRQDFDSVHDPLYPWENMRYASPDEWKKREAVKKSKLDEVKEYKVDRAKYWKLMETVNKGMAMEETISITEGISDSKTVSSSTTITQMIGMKLGLALKGDMFGLPGQASGDLTSQLSIALNFTSSETHTYKKEVTRTEKVMYAPNTLYAMWQVLEFLCVYRISRDGSSTLMSQMDVWTSQRYTDSLSMA